MRIGEVAEITGLSISNIRFYEKKGLIEPDRESQSKYRDYTDADIDRLNLIILYRKMNFPIETIAELIAEKISVESALEQQLSDLKQQQIELQGSIDLCNKIIEDKAFYDIDVRKYIDYVREEEAQGIKFAEVDEFMEEFAVVTNFNKLAGGIPFINFALIHPKLYRFMLWGWFCFWVLLPIIILVLQYVEDGKISTTCVIMVSLIWGVTIVPAVTYAINRKRK